MAPSAVFQEKMKEGNYNGNPVNDSGTMTEQGIKGLKLTGTSVKNPTARYLMDRDLNDVPLNVINSKGNYLYLSNGQKILDSTGGAAVAALGHGNAEVKQAMIDQMDKATYFNSMLFTADPNGELAEEVIRGTGYLMSKMFVCSSGK
jgi:adenosylmethionine-8-amino-7-oxononanoate aminotransferase